MALSDTTLSKLISKEKLKISNNNFDFDKTFPKDSKKRLHYYKYMNKLGFKDNEVQKLSFDGRQIESGSIDLRLGNSFSKIATNKSIVKLGEKINYQEISENPIIYPGEYMLGTTQETIFLPSNIAATVDGRSSIGRIGLHVENAGWVDPGFEGEITLELFNSGNIAIELVPGYRVCQLVFEKTNTKPTFPYNGKYQNQKDATGSKTYKDYDIKEML